MKNLDSRGKFSKAFWLSVVTAAWMFCVNTFGFVDTFTNSSLSLGRTWPFTDHGLFPQSWDAAKYIEYTHRVLVSGLLILLLTLTVICWLKYRKWVEVKVLTIVAILFVFIEAFLGAMAVMFDSPATVKALHMGVALVSFCAVVVLTGVIGSIDKHRLLATGEALRPHATSKSYARLSWFSLVYVLFSIYFGSFVARSGAGGEFRGWPLPTESYAHAGSAFIIDIAHRGLALGLLILLVTLTVWAYKMRSVRRDLYRAGVASLILTFLQAVSGAILIYTSLSIGAFLLHVCIVTGILAVTAYMAVQTLPEPSRVSRRERKENERKLRATARA